MQIHRKVGAVLAGAALVMSGACSQDLNVTNPNNPDIARVLATPADVQNLAVSSVHSWYQAATMIDPWVMLNVTGDLMTMNYGNFGARFNNLEPRIPYNNSSTSGDEEVVANPWNDQYSTIGAANAVLKSLAKGTTLPGGTDKYKALALFSQAGALMEISLVFDQGFPVDEAADASTVKLVPYTDMAKFTKGKIDALISFTSGQSFTYDQASEFPASIQPEGNDYSTNAVGTGMDSHTLNRIANTWGAQLLAYTPRTAAEAAKVDWASVLNYAKKGIGHDGGAPIDFAMVGDYNNWWSDLVSYFDLPSWMMVDLHLIHQMAPNVPTSYTGQPASPRSAYDGVWAPQAPMDARLGIDTTDVNSYAAGVDDKTDFVYAAQVQGSAARGIYMQSPYYHVRYISVSWQSNNPQVGPAVYNLAAESDLLEAEAIVRTGGDLQHAADLVNYTRVGRGNLTPLTATSSTATFLQAITYELEVECNATDGYGFFALRGMDQLQNGTARHLPLPAQELQTDGLPVYTFGGVGKPDMDVTGIQAPVSTPVEFNMDKFQQGPWRALNLPDGSSMLLPSPRSFKHSRPTLGRF
ncbi:MAG TPA: hypothetical protein VFT41_05230 [Gemmatimonadaceae bacterium]|nr:hypothetical protein [Gemmatimonadaceae bacterium]